MSFLAHISFAPSPAAAAGYQVHSHQSLADLCLVAGRHEPPFLLVVSASLAPRVVDERGHDGYEVGGG